MALVPVQGTHQKAVFSSRARLAGAGLLWAAACLMASGCQGERAPSVQSEPTRESAAVAQPVAAAAPAAGSVATPSAAAASSAGAAPTAAPGAVGLAKYEPAAVPAAQVSATTVEPAVGAAQHAASAHGAAADGPAKPASGQPIQGAAISEEPFSIWLQSVSPIPAGSAATVEAVLVAKPPYHCNADYPHKFKLAAAPTGLAYPETTVKGAKVTAEKSVLPIPVQAQSPGKAKVSGTLSFSVCNEERCLVEKRELSLDLEVK